MKIAGRAKHIVQSFLLKRGYRIATTSDPSALRRFFRSIHPIVTEHGLIRIGGEGDGGYLVPDDLGGVATCFSPGVSKIADFELDLAGRGIKCFLADYSVEAPPVTHDLFHFEKKFLGTVEDAKFMTLENWVERNAPDGRDMILQMDIEGAEYGVILDTSHEVLRKFRMIIVEFHDLDALVDRRGLDLLSLAFGKLLVDFDVVHIHPNNVSGTAVYGEFVIPSILEFTFLRKDRIGTRRPAQTFPHPLDSPNVAYRNDRPLPRCWYN
jgi:hypothetical protein